MSRLPLTTRDDLLDELQLIEWDRERILAGARNLNPEGRANYLDSLAEWERDLREQLADRR